LPSQKRKSKQMIAFRKITTLLVVQTLGLSEAAFGVAPLRTMRKTTALHLKDDIANSEYSATKLLLFQLLFKLILVFQGC